MCTSMRGRVSIVVYWECLYSLYHNKKINKTRNLAMCTALKALCGTIHDNITLTSLMHSKFDILFTQLTGWINSQQVFKYIAQFLLVSVFTLEKIIQIPKKKKRSTLQVSSCKQVALRYGTPEAVI